MKMKDKVVVVTGGGQGIGLGIARAFAAEGASLAITGRNLDKLETACRAQRPASASGR